MPKYSISSFTAAAAAAKSLQSCPTLCNPQMAAHQASCPWNSPGKNTGVGCHFLLQCMRVKSESEVAQSCPTLVTPWTAAYQAPPSMGFSRQKYWSGVPLPSLSSFTKPAQIPVFHSQHVILAKFSLVHQKIKLEKQRRYLGGPQGREVNSVIATPQRGVLAVQVIMQALEAKEHRVFRFSSDQFSSVTQSCLTLCDPMNCRMPGLPVHHQLLEFTQTHVH